MRRLGLAAIALATLALACSDGGGEGAGGDEGAGAAETSASRPGDAGDGGETEGPARAGSDSERAAGGGGAGDGPADPEQAVAAWEAWESAAAMGSAASLASLYAEGAELVLGDGATVAGAERIEHYFELLFRGVPDLEREPIAAIAREGEVAVLATARGTHEGEVLGTPATGSDLGRAELARFFVSEGGTIERHIVYADRLNLQAQMGRREVQARAPPSAPEPGRLVDALEVPREGAAGAREEEATGAAERMLAALADGDAGAVAGEFAEGAVLHDAAAASSAASRGEIRRHAAGLLAAFPDLAIEDVEVFAAGDTALATFALAGTHRGMWRRAREPASDATFETAGAAVVRTRGGAIERAWWIYDGLAIARAIEEARRGE